MAVFPNFPGVPQLLDYVSDAATQALNSLGIPQFLTGDLINTAMFGSGRQWGLFLGASPAILFESFVNIEYKQEWAIADYPIERGGFESYNKVQIPYNIKARFASGGTEESRTALLESVQAIAGDLKLYTIVTPEKVYTSVNVQHIDYHRTSISGVGMIVIDILLLEVRTRVVEAQSEKAETPGQTTRYSIDVIPRGPATQSPFPSSPVAPFVDNPFNPQGSNVFNNGYVSTFDSRFNAISPGVVRNDPSLTFRVF